MSRSRFKELLRCIRFDVRAERNRNDKLAPVRRIFEMMATKFRSSYRAEVNITVDEQLMTYRGRCPFEMFLKEKPGKFGHSLIQSHFIASICKSILVALVLELNKDRVSVLPWN